MERIEIQKLYDWAGAGATELAEELIKFAAALKSNYKIRLFLSDENVPLTERKEILVPLLNNSSSALKDLVNLLLEKELLSEIDRIGERFARLVESNKAMEFAEIESAYPLDSKEIDKIKKTFGGKVSYRWRQNANLIGGFVLRYTDGKVFDASVKGKLNQIKAEMAG